jgi:Tfp pilus assembly protein PilN
MRAVNLIPSDQRSGASVGAGRSEGAAYGVLALLVAVAALALLYGKAHRDVESNKDKAASVNAQAQRAQAEASQLAPYTSFVALRTQREQAVAGLVDSRFDWAHAFHEFGRVLTGQTQITSLSGSIAAAATTTATPAAAAPATAATSTATPAATSASTSATPATSATTAVTSATPAGSVPTFTITGCATSQPAVATMLERLRLIDGVATVTLQSSTKGAGGAASSNGCPANGPDFNVTVAFDALPSASAAAAAVKGKSSGAQTVADSTTASSPATSATGAQTTNASGGANQ